MPSMLPMSANNETAPIQINFEISNMERTELKRNLNKCVWFSVRLHIEVQPLKKIFSIEN